MTISSHPPDVVDAYISMRAQRLQADRFAASLKEQEDDLKKFLIGYFREQGSTALGGKAGLVKLQHTVEPDPLDWPAFRAFIKENDAWELLHQRVTSTAVRERWEAGQEIPGIGRRDVYNLSVSGAK